VLATVAVGAPAVSQAAGGRDHAVAPAAAAPNPGDYVLRKGGAPAGNALAGLDGKLKKSGVQALLNAPGNRKAAHRGSCGSRAGVPAGSDWFCFNRGDTATKEWYPQGVTGVSDAQDDELWGSEQALLVSWYDHDKRKPHKSVRVTFVNTRTSTYRHVLLVWPYQRGGGGPPTYEPVGTHGTAKGIHAGGVAWYGNRLFVADTTRGVRVFDMRLIFDLGASKNGTTSGAGKVGLHGKTYYGYGYRYVMPQVGSWVNTKTTGKPCTGSGAPVHSFLSIDRSKVPDMLASGEYCGRDDAPNKGRNGRIALWPLQTAGAAKGDLLSDGNGEVHPRFVNGLPDSNIQGAAGANGTWWFTHNTAPKGGPSRGQLIGATWAPGGGWTGESRRTISYGPEDLSCWRGRHLLWTVGEHPKRRALYGVPESGCA
jgi:hypothetical protein